MMYYELDMKNMASRFRRVTNKHSLSLLFYLGGIFIGLSFVLSWGAWIILPGLFLVFLYVDKFKSSLKRMYLDFYVIGFTVMGFAHLFFFQTATDNWPTTVNGLFVYVSQFVAWFIVVSLCAVPFVGLAWIISKISNRELKIASILFLWPAMEAVRALLFSFISYGPGGRIGIDFSFGGIAVSASGTQLIYISRIFGYYGLSFGILALVFGTYLLYLKRLLLGSFVSIMVLLLVVVGYILSTQNTAAGLKIVSVHLSESDSLDKWNNFDKLPNEIDLLVLPEYSEATKSDVIQSLSKKLSSNGVAITTKSIGKSPKSYNQLTFFNKQGKIISKQDKTFLVPMGEYIPWTISSVLKVTGQQDLLDTFNYTQSILRGDTPESVVSYGGVTFGALPCSGVLNIAQYKNLKSQGADILINPASLAFLNKNNFYNIYGYRMARFQAVSNNLNFVQASRSGQSFMLDQRAKIIGANKSQDTEVIVF